MDSGLKGGNVLLELSSTCRRRGHPLFYRVQRKATARSKLGKRHHLAWPTAGPQAKNEATKVIAVDVTIHGQVSGVEVSNDSLQNLQGMAVQWLFASRVCEKIFLRHHHRADFGLNILQPLRLRPSRSFKRSLN